MSYNHSRQKNKVLPADPGSARKKPLDWRKVTPRQHQKNHNRHAGNFVAVGYDWMNRSVLRCF